MKQSLLLLSLTGLGCGAAAAWLTLPPRPGAPEFTGQPATVTTAIAASTEAGAAQRLTDSWRRLRASGSTGWHRRLALFSLAEVVPASQIRRLLDQTPLHDIFARELLLRRWLALDPAAAGAWAALVLSDSSTDPTQTASESQLVLATLAAKDPTGTLELIHKSGSPSNTVPFTYTILGKLLETDMAAGIAFGAACREPDSVMNWSLSPSDETGWIKRDPARAASLLGTLPPGSFRDRSLCAAVAAMAEKNFTAALALHRKFPRIQPGRHLDDPRTAFYQQWAKQDLDGFTEYVNEEATGKTRLVMKEAIATALGEKDPRTALPWIADNLSGQHREKALKSVVTQLTKSDPAAARAYLTTLSDGSILGAAMEAFYSALPAKDHAGLFEQVKTLPEGPARTRLAGKAYQAWFRSDPGAALQELAATTPENLPDGLWRSLGQQSASPAEAMKQLNNLPLEARTDFVRGLWATHLAEALPAELSTSLETLTDPAQRSAALGVIAGGRNPGRAVEWAKTLPNPEDRKQIADGVSKSLSHFPAKEREALLAPLR